MKHCYAIVTTCIIVLGLFTMPLDADQGYDRETSVRTMHQVSGFIRQLFALPKILGSNPSLEDFMTKVSVACQSHVI